MIKKAGERVHTTDQNAHDGHRGEPPEDTGEGSASLHQAGRAADDQQGADPENPHRDQAFLMAAQRSDMD
ncbi:hypothetical protein MLGJGCBP_03130 [Rhodococcus sp. T7]|nr:MULTISPECIES: hypothetical protein [Rhodococcus]KAF0957559.1 hypothetical protein MLGJGCBP_09391 [Rhodococcus sp. T7]KAF0963734.1 hypothetical protein MLGJGCBP_03130 [Rhodococcus sp. T7]QQZ18228.1 hypothetical protein GO592_38935 [Rhodococcus sp. 21391]UOT08157.1 hypothetical protein MPY17_38030 [Rhodococcus opacus]